MDALGRIEPVARELMTRVDSTLVTFGAPGEHPILAHVREVGAKPGDAVAFFAAADPAPLRAAGSALRDQVGAYAAVEVPARIPWEGAAGDEFSTRAAALAAHVGVGIAAESQTESLSGRLRATASYVEDIAQWYEQSRAEIARALGEVLTSMQAVTVCSCAALAGDHARSVPGGVPADVVVAAADIGAYVLAVAGPALVEGHELRHRWAPSLADLPFHAATPAGPARPDAAIHLRT